MQSAWAWFDKLSNLQATSFLLVVLTGMLTAAICLLIATFALLPAPRSASPAAALAEPRAASAERAATADRKAERNEPVLPRTATILSTVNLRVEPTTSARSLAALPQHTQLELLDDGGSVEPAIWRHVRTADGREGWIIATALD